MPDIVVPGARPAARHVVLIGAMGSGKSTVGAALASALGRPFLDNDAQLHAATGSTAAGIAARDGIDALHEQEARLVRTALGDGGGSVIAAAASTIADPAVREALAAGAFVVWLHADASVARGADAAVGFPAVRRRGSRRIGRAGSRVNATRSSSRSPTSWSTRATRRFPTW